MLKIILLFLMYSAQASDQWLCTDQGSQRRGDDTVLACGTASELDEKSARWNAMEEAKSSFNQICLMNADCKGFKYRAAPGRIECEKNINGDFKCTQLIQFTIVDDRDPDIHSLSNGTYMRETRYDATIYLSKVKDVVLE